MWVGIDLGLEYSRYSILGEDGELLEHGSVRSTEAGLRGRFSAIEASLMAVAFDGRMTWALDLLTGLGHALLIAGELPQTLRPALVPLVELLARQTTACESAPVSERTGRGGDLTRDQEHTAAAVHCARVTGEERTVVFRRSGDDAEAGLMFMVTVEDLLGRQAVSDAWYFVGPVANGMGMAGLGERTGQGGVLTQDQEHAAAAVRCARITETLAPGAGRRDGHCTAERALRLYRLWEMGEIPLPRNTRIAA